MEESMKFKIPDLNISIFETNINDPEEANNSIVENVVNYEQVRMEKGTWTNKEDAILVDYIHKHIHDEFANWKTVERECGLNRSARSCRLRWLNHLRPGLKKEKITAEEEEIIVRLHAKMGNKWACIAEKVPGRTDNEVKNFWNSRLNRCARDSLPVYPSDVVEELKKEEEKQKKKRKENQQKQKQLNIFMNSSLLLHDIPIAPAFSSYQNSNFQFGQLPSFQKRPNLIEEDFRNTPSHPNFPSSSSSSSDAATTTGDFLVADQNNFPLSSSYVAATTATDDQNQPSSSSELPSIQSTDVLNLPPIEEQ